MLIKIIEFLIYKIKGRTIKIDKKVTTQDIAIEIAKRLKYFIIGFIKISIFKKQFKLIFCAPNVSISNIKYIEFSGGNTLNQGVIINGLSSSGIHLGKNVSIGPYSIIRASYSLNKIGGGVVIHDNTSLDAFCFLGAAGGIEIGENVLIGQHVSFHAQNHNYQFKDKLIKDQGVTSYGIKVGSDCWIGANVTILDGVIIGKGCVVGAGSVVTRNIPDYAVVVGVPAKIVKYRE